MIRRRFYKVLALILAFLFVSAAMPAGFGECDSPCCGQRGCQPAYGRAVPETCHGLDAFAKELRSGPCKMSKARIFQTAQSGSLTGHQKARPAGKAYAVLFFHPGPFPDSYEAQFSGKPSAMIRAAPKLLYLQHVTLLI
jgi:hypothetical protein